MGMSLKSSKVNATYLSGKGNTLGITSLDFRSTIQFPKLPGIFATPRFSWHFLDGPASTDLPGQLYNLSVDFLMVRPIGRNWMLHLAIAPGLNTDFNNVSSDSLRVMGRGLAFYNWSPALQLVGGVVYLDRDDIPLLPAAGLVYTPNEDTKIEVMFPRPRVARPLRGHPRPRTVDLSRRRTGRRDLGRRTNQRSGRRSDVPGSAAAVRR